MQLDFYSPFKDDGRDINLNNSYFVKQYPAVQPAKDRAQVMIKQGLRIIHAQHSHSIVSEREDMYKRLVRAVGNRAYPIVDYYPHEMQGLRAPFGSEKAHRIKTGNLVFETLDPVTGESSRVNHIGTSSTYISGCYNGLPVFMDVKFVGVAQTETDPTDKANVREDLTVATFGMEKILNNSPLTIPANTAIFMSNFPYWTKDEHDNMIPAIDLSKEEGQMSDTFLPAIFYLTDTCMYSMVKRIDAMIDYELTEVDRGLKSSKVNDLKNIVDGYVKAISKIANRRSSTFELRRDFVLYDIATIKGFLQILDRIDVFKYDNRASYGIILAHAVQLAIRAIGWIGMDRSDIITRHLRGMIGNNSPSQVATILRSDFLKDKDELSKVSVTIKGLNDLLENAHNDANTVEPLITKIANLRYWLRKRLTDSVDMLMSEGQKILKNMYIGRSREAASPGEWMDVEILA